MPGGLRTMLTRGGNQCERQWKVGRMGEAWGLIGMLLTFGFGFALGWILRSRPLGPHWESHPDWPTQNDWAAGGSSATRRRPPDRPRSRRPASPRRAAPLPNQAPSTEPVDVPIQPREHPVDVVQGIGPGYSRRLNELGIETTLDLIGACRDPDRFLEVIDQLGVQEAVVRRWACQCDLLRVPDLDAQGAELLEAAGVLRVRDLLAEDPVRLARKLREVNDELRLTPDDVPDAELLNSWIDQARFLDRS